MVDDLLGADGISKEYLVILKQIEDYCSRGPEIDLDFQQSPNGNVLNFELNLISVQLLSDTKFHKICSVICLRASDGSLKTGQVNLHFLSVCVVILFAKRITC